MQKNRYIIVFTTIAILTFIVLGVIRWTNTPKIASRLDGGLLTSPITESGVQTLIPSEYILNTGLNKEQVPPITNPVFTTIAASDAYLNDTTNGISLEVDGQQRFYPVQILNHHYVVLDQDAQGSFAVTYCVFCRAGVVYDTNKKLHASEYVYSNNTLLEDEDGNLWSQMTGMGVRGDNIGERLQMRANVDIMTWADWKKMYPQGRVLSSETGYTRDYGRHPFGGYDNNSRIYYPLSHIDTRIPKKWLLNGVLIDGQPVGFVHRVFAGFNVYQDKVNEIPYVALYNDLPQVNIFSSVVNGETLEFTYDADTTYVTDIQTGSIWNANGYAIEGSFAGTQLTRLPSVEAMSMCWMSMYPESLLPKVPDVETDTESHDESTPKNNVPENTSNDMQG